MNWRILHVLDHCLPLHSGYTFRSLAILRHQRALGWQTVHLTAVPSRMAGNAGDGSGHAADEAHVDGWHFYRTLPSRSRLARWPVLGQLARIIALRGRLLAVARRERPHVIHAHSPALNGIAALSVGKALKIPVVYEVRAFWEDAAADHGTSPPGSLRYLLTRLLETYVMRHAQAVTTLCIGLRDDIVARGIAAHRVTVIPNAVETAPYMPATACGAAGANEQPGLLAHELGLTGRLVIGFIGSFYAYEGLELLIRALPAMLVQISSMHLLLVGGGPQQHRLQALASALGVSQHVTFAGRVPHAGIDRYYRLIEILVYPRLPMRLTELVTPLKPLEAMARERLVVASDVGGHRELLEDGVNGVLFRAGDADALATAVVQLLRQPARWPTLRRLARAHVERERTWPASVARYDAVYTAALQALGSRPR